MTYLKAEEAILSLNQNEIDEYTNYWNLLIPRNKDEIFDRWLFAILSVHTTWSMNVSSFLSLKQSKEHWINDRNELSQRLKETKVGLYKVREESIWQLAERVQKDPTNWHLRFAPYAKETWISCRDRIAQFTFGLGRAKAAFALELCHPMESKSVCLDTHMLQLYDLDPTKCTDPQYYTAERHWVSTCNIIDVPPYIARCLFWDKKQKKQSSSYWSYVFEDKKEINDLADTQVWI